MVALLCLGIGYAAISAVNLIINGNATGTFNQANFKVKFTTASVTSGAGTAAIDSNDPKVATFDVTGLTKEEIEELEDLEWVSQTISEYNYYNNTNK